MIPKLNILTILFLIVIMACSKKQNISKLNYSSDKAAFYKSLEKYSQIDKEASNFVENNKVKILNDPNFAVINLQKILTQSNYVIKESDKVSDEFLNFLHPELKKLYRDTFIGSIKTMIEYGDKGDYINYVEKYKHIYDMQKTFYSFLQDNEGEINKKISSLQNAPSKTYWRMLLMLTVSNIISVILFSFFLMTLLLPLMPIGLIGHVWKQIDKGILAIISIPFIFFAGIGQTYFWILWAAFCAFTIQYYMDSPLVSYRWLYYITGLMFVTGPISWFSYKESQSAKSNNEYKKIQRGTSYYSLIAIIAFFIFCIWSNLLDYKYISWLNDWIY